MGILYLGTKIVNYGEIYSVSNGEGRISIY